MRTRREPHTGAYDRIIGLDTADVSVDASLHKAPSGGPGTGPNPCDRAKSGRKWSLACDGRGIPVGWAAAGTNRHDSALLEPTLDAVQSRGLLEEIGTLHLDRGSAQRCRSRTSSDRSSVLRPSASPRSLRNQLPSVPAPIPNSRAISATGLRISRTIRTAPALNSGLYWRRISDMAPPLRRSLQDPGGCSVNIMWGGTFGLHKLMRALPERGTHLQRADTTRAIDEWKRVE